MREPVALNGGDVSFNIACEETLRGPPTGAGPVSIGVTAVVEAGAIHAGTPVILCLDPFDRVVAIVPLAGPDAVCNVGSDSSEDGEPVVSADLQPLPAAQFLDALRREALRPQAPTLTLTNGDPPANLQPDLLVVPLDDRLPALATRWAESPNPNARLFAADLLGEKVSDAVGLDGLSLKNTDPLLNRAERVALARPLLVDPWLSDAANNTSPFTPRVYWVRMMARDALLAGTPAAQLKPASKIAALLASAVINAPNTQYRRFPFLWPVLVLIALSGGIYAFARRRRWPLRLAPALLPACGLLLLGAWRNTFIADDFFWSVRPFCISLTSYAGGIQLLWFDKFPASMPLAHTTLLPEPSVGDGIVPNETYFWHRFGTNLESAATEDYPVTAITFRRRDLPDPTSVTSTGGTVAALTDVPSLDVPYHDLLLAAAAILLVTCAPAVPAIRRRVRARNAGLCPRCGFDVRIQRAAPSPRCPECGTALPAMPTPPL
ncbi:MAG TPA: hypothetical protein VHQ47_16115 [Phycisphaerae bacterium]|nr:hypothetical protein [Phycisphaerae bacterium]